MQYQAALIAGKLDFAGDAALLELDPTIFGDSDNIIIPYLQSKRLQSRSKTCTKSKCIHHNIEDLYIQMCAMKKSSIVMVSVGDVHSVRDKSPYAIAVCFVKSLQKWRNWWSSVTDAARVYEGSAINVYWWLRDVC